jgi:hypothetical protein
MSRPSPRGSTLFAAIYKRPAEGRLGLFCFFPLGLWGLGFLGVLAWALASFALTFLVWEAFGREKNC